MTTGTTGSIEDLISDHLYLVQHVVHGLAARYPAHVDRQDLWSAGATGLVEAARRYDPDSEVSFAHYARQRIAGAIVDSTRARDWATRGVRRHARELSTVTADFEQRHHRAPTDEELAARLGVGVDEVVRRRAAAHRGTVLSLDRPVGSHDAAPAALSELVVTHDPEDSPEARLEERELVGSVRAALEFLNEGQRSMVERYYLHGHRLRDIAASMGVTEARASQLRKEAVRALRSYLHSAAFDVADVEQDAPGKRERAAFVARVAEHTTWRSRLNAADTAVVGTAS